MSRNGDAPIVVMTTEVLRNMIYADAARLADLRCVVLDEVHYLEDRYRGSVWEEIILSAPPEVVLVCLSATVSNAEELAGWIEHVRGSTAHVIEERRPIELRHLYVLGIRATHRLEILPTFVDGTPNPEAIALDARSRPPARAGVTAARAGRPVARSPVFRPRRAEVVERFAEEDLLPAIYFVFSRAGCDDAVRQCLEAGLRLTTPEERRVIRTVVDDHVAALSDADLRVLGYGRFVEGLEAGFAPHHAGLVPPFREAVEALFGAAIVKVVFATETLALGINMPARSVIIESLSKFSGTGHEDLTAGSYTQLTGRAGRRGIDQIGHAAVLWSPFHTFVEVSALASARSRALRSSFRPTYNMAVNLVRRYPPDDAYRLVRSSFAQYLSEVPLTRELDAVVGLLAARGYLAGWRVTDFGDRLAGIYHDCDLLVAEAVSTGLLGGLDAPSLAAMVSLFTFEPRRGASPGELPNARLARRAAELDELAGTSAKRSGRGGSRARAASTPASPASPTTGPGAPSCVSSSHPPAGRDGAGPPTRSPAGTSSATRNSSSTCCASSPSPRRARVSVRSRPAPQTSSCAGSSPLRRPPSSPTGRERRPTREAPRGGGDPRPAGHGLVVSSG